MQEQLKTFGATRAVLKELGLPAGDYENFAASTQEFAAGGHYGIELSSMNNPKILKQALDLADKYKVKVSRVIECRGIMRLPDDDIKEMVQICAERRIGLMLSIGPRAISDIGGFVSAPNGVRLGYRLRGMERVIQAIEDVKRALSLGVRGFLVYDEGLLWLLNQMRADGKLPQDIVYKFSVHSGCANPVSAKLLEHIGADCINIIPDLNVWEIKTFREAIKVPLDVFSDTAKAAGGFLRTYDVPDIIRYAAPVYLKCGPISQPQQNHLPSDTELEERVKQARNVVEHIQRYLPEAKTVSENEKSLAIPGFASESDVEQLKNTIQDLDDYLLRSQHVEHNADFFNTPEIA